MITPEDRAKYPDHTDDAILGIKLIGGLHDDVILSALSDIKAPSARLSSPIEIIGILLDWDKTGSFTSKSWIRGIIIEEAYARKMIDAGELSYLECRI